MGKKTFEGVENLKQEIILPINKIDNDIIAKTTLRVCVTTHTELKVLSAKLHTSISDLIIRGAKLLLSSKNIDDLISKKLNQLKASNDNNNVKQTSIKMKQSILIELKQLSAEHRIFLTDLFLISIDLVLSQHKK